MTVSSILHSKELWFISFLMKIPEIFRIQEDSRH